ncbi:hypothetical protein [Vreelandella venusta]
MTLSHDASASKDDTQAFGHSPDASQQRQQQLLDVLRQTAP